MNCPICGSEVAAGTKFCQICGANVTNQQSPQQVQQHLDPQMPKPKKEKKKKKNVAVKVIAAVMAFVIVAVGALFLVDSIMFKKEVEAKEIITDFPVLKQKTELLVYDAEIFPSDHYKITVERVITGNVLKSDTFRQTKVIIEDESTEPVYKIDFEEDGEYIITLEDISDEKEPETTAKVEATTVYNESEPETETEAETKKEPETEESLIIVIKAKVDDASEDAIDKVDLNSRKGDDPVEIPENVSEPETTSEDIENEDETEFESEFESESEVATTDRVDEDDDETDKDEPVSNVISDDDNTTSPEFSIGSVTGTEYTNSFIGLSCTLPSDWTIYNEEQILELNNIVGSYMDDSIMEQLKKANIVYALVAVDEATGDNLNVNFEKVDPALLAKYSNKEILESQIGTIKSTFSNMGYSDIDAKYQKVTVKGKSFDSLKLTANINGIDYYATVVYYRVGSNMICINVGSMQSDRTNTFLDYFTFS